MRSVIVKSLILLLATCYCDTNISGQSRDLGRRHIEVEINDKKTRVVLSPNEDLVVWAENDGSGREIVIADADGTNIRKLTDNRSYDFEPEWSPDGDRILFTSHRTGVYQIHSMDPTGGDLKQLTKNEHGAKRPMFSSEGHLVWQVLHAKNGKIHPTDVMVRLSGSEIEKTLLAKASLPGYLWHPDGKVLVVGSIGTIQFINIETDECKTVSFPEIDSRLNSHRAENLQWSPDGKQIACQITFVGGRIGDPKLFGDKEIFLINQEGEADVYDGPDSAKAAHRWIKLK